MLSELFNLVEGAWWIGLGGWILFSTFIQKRAYKRAIFIILILFGISDFVEIFTGTWWEPWWLLVWKAMCVAGAIIFIILIVLERRVK